MASGSRTSERHIVSKPVLDKNAPAKPAAPKQPVAAKPGKPGFQTASIKSPVSNPAPRPRPEPSAPDAAPDSQVFNLDAPSENNAAPKRKIGIAARKKSSGDNSRMSHTSVRMNAGESSVAGGHTTAHSTHTGIHSANITQTGINFAGKGDGKHKPKMTLALKFAVPMAAVIVLVFFLLSMLVLKQMTAGVSREIVKSGVAQVSMLASIGSSIIEKASVLNWPVEEKLLPESAYNELLGKCPAHKLRKNRDKLIVEIGDVTEQDKALYVAQRAGLLRDLITSSNSKGNFHRTQTKVAYIICSQNEVLKLYGSGAKSLLLARSETAEEIAKGKNITDADFSRTFKGSSQEKSTITGNHQDYLDPNEAGDLDIDDQNISWVPSGVNLKSYTVGEKELSPGTDGFPCEIYPGVVKGSGARVLAFSYPIFSSVGNVKIGVAVIGIDAGDIVSSVASIRNTLLALGLFAIIIAVGICLFIGYSATRPIGVLIADMGLVANGDLSHKSHVQSNDEIGMLARQFNAMTDKLQGAVDTEKKMAAVEGELDIAREIQKKLLPDKLPKIPGLDIAATYHPAKEVGGDYYDFFPIDDTHIGIMVADVSGKGVPGSMVMGTTRTILHFAAERNTSSADTLKRTNAMVAADIKRGMFVTAFYLVLDTVNMSMICSSAGHNPMVVIHKNGQYDLVNPNGIALGFDKGRIFDRTIKEQAISLQSGDRVVLYTDGVVEAMNLLSEEYTDERFYAFVQKHFTHTSEAFVNELLEDLNRHKCSADTRAKKAEQHDDITIVTFRVM